MIKLLFIGFVFGIVSSLQAQVTLIPDPVFELLLIDNGMDTDGMINGQVSTADIADETLLGINYPQIEDITGIQDFASLKTLILMGVNVAEMDISQNSNLEILDIDTLPLQKLVITNNVNLKNFYFSGGHDCSGCPFSSSITYIDFSSNSLLERVIIGGSIITSLDFSQNFQLDNVEIFTNADLQQINLKNGFNTLISRVIISSTNTNLNCIQVDDPAAVIAGVTPPYDNWEINSTATIATDCFLGIDDFLQNDVVYYPNPVKDILKINSKESITKIKVFDITGKLLLEKTGNIQEIAIATLPSGILVIQLETEKGILVEKIVKE